MWKTDLESRWQTARAKIEAEWGSFSPSNEEVVILDEMTATKVFARGDRLTCPICGNQNSHVVSACARKGVDEYESGKGYLGVENRGRTRARRDALCVGVECESGCKFNIVFQQEKGTEYIDIEVLKKDLIESRKELANDNHRI